MQKFVVIKRTQKPCVDIIETQVRMSGYLKKKRNRVGGWRKQWFVLQNQLLLSYSSRGDYEKKLVPFKDVINLVPGSVVRPASGSRFTIESTSNTLYTFRCIDSKTCAEWIMAILESISLVAQTVIDKNLSFVMQNKDYQNMFGTSSRSCESLSRPMSRSGKFARIPIANNSTKRLVERGCIDDSNYVKVGKDDTDIGVQNFRLHQNQNALKENQSKEVSRINRMFQSCASENNNVILKQIKQSMDLNQNKMDGQIYSNIEEQIQQMTLDEETEGENNVERKIIKTVGSHLNKDEFIDVENVDIINGMRYNGDEAIYAVVDLKDKHARRARLREMERERPKSFHVITSSNDYEEVNNISSDLFVKSMDGENIYEPVNVSGQTNRNIMWRYFPKINFDSFIEFARIGHRDQQHNYNNKIAPIKITTTTTTTKTTVAPSVETIIKEKPDDNNDQTSSFADMKRKLGNHRRSIKDKMKKFYSRDERRRLRNINNIEEKEQQCTNILNEKSPSGSISQNSNYSSEKDSFLSHDNERPIKRDRTIFGSLPRMRKSRTTPSINDFMKKKKIIIKKKDDTEFQIELKNELSKRTDRKITDL